MTILIISFLFFVGGVVFFLVSEDRTMRKEWKKIGEQETQLVLCRRQIEQAQKLCTELQVTNGYLKSDVKVFRQELDTLHAHLSEVQTLQRGVNIKADLLETKVDAQPKAMFPAEISFVLIDKRNKTEVKSKPTEGGHDVKKEPNKQDQTPRPNSKPSGSRKASLGRSFASIRKENSKRV